MRALEVGRDVGKVEYFDQPPAAPDSLCSVCAGGYDVSQPQADPIFYFLTNFREGGVHGLDPRKLSSFKRKPIISLKLAVLSSSAWRVEVLVHDEAEKG